MNKSILCGNLCKDIELRTTENNKSVVSNSIAIRNDFKNADGEYGTTFINVVIWGQQAEYLSKYASKGSKVLLEGRISNRSYDKQDGTTAYITEVVANKIELLSYKKEEQEETQVPQNYKTDYQETDEVKIDDSDLPF